MRYLVKKVDSRPVLGTAVWNQEPWKSAENLHIDQFLPESGSHHPETKLKLLHDGTSFFGLFNVHDRYVRCVNTEYQSNVCRDSCVECFLQPKPDKGYFNFEFNCGGALLCFHIEDATRTPNGFKKYQKLRLDELKDIEIFHSLPSIIDPEITDPTPWFLGFATPKSFFEPYVGHIQSLSGMEWRGNFYKCGDKTSHPHWASWAPIHHKNFHLPDCFQSVFFE